MSDSIKKESQPIDWKCKNYKCPYFEQLSKYNCKIFHLQEPFLYCKNYTRKKLETKI